MTKSKKIITAITIPVATLLIAILILFAIYVAPYLIDLYKHRNWTKLDFCEANWQVTLPKDATIEYSYSNRGGFLGDGVSYTVCKYFEQNYYFEDNFERDDDGKYAQKYNNILPLLKPDVDESKLFSPNDDFIWFSKVKQENCTLLLAYDTVNYVMYIVEDIM